MPSDIAAMQNAANLELAIGTSTNVVTRAPAIAPSVFSAYPLLDIEPYRY